MANLTNKARNTYCSADSNYSCLPRHAPGQFLQLPSGIHSFCGPLCTWIYKHDKRDGLQAEDNNTFFRHSVTSILTYMQQVTLAFSSWNQY